MKHTFINGYSKMLNQNFKVFVEYFDEFLCQKIRRPVGYTGLYFLLGSEWCHKLILRAYTSMSDICIFKLRRGLKIEFRSK